MKDRYGIVGVGNVLLRDEGIGVYAANYLKRNYRFEPEIDVVDGATLGFRLLPFFQTYEKLIILDVVSIKDDPGGIYRLPSEEMLGLGSYRQSAHEIEIVEMLELCTLQDRMADAVVFGVVPQDIDSMELGLTEPLREVFPAYIEAVLQELKKDKIGFEKVGSLDLDTVIQQSIHDPSWD